MQGGLRVDWSHFGIARRPFWSAVDTASYFASPSHEAAAHTIQAAFHRGEPAALLDGPPGCGKSLIALRWLESLPAETSRIVLANLQWPRPADLHQAILFDLNLPYRGLSEQELRLAVTEHLLSQTPRTVLVIDEAQNLGEHAFEELRLLGNIESGGRSMLFVLLAAQPRIHDALRQSEPFAQRLGAKCHIELLSIEESTAYLRHQVKFASGDPDAVFDAEAVELIAGACQGVARLLNRAAHSAAELAADAGAEMIDVEAAMEAVARLALSAAEVEEDTIPLKHSAKAKKAKLKRSA
jgi:type II secretory pathway predicted ATPase ExeA